MQLQLIPSPCYLSPNILLNTVAWNTLSQCYTHFEIIQSANLILGSCPRWYNIKTNGEPLVRFSSNFVGKIPREWWWDVVYNIRDVNELKLVPRSTLYNILVSIINLYINMWRRKHFKQPEIYELEKRNIKNTFRKCRELSILTSLKKEGKLLFLAK